MAVPHPSDAGLAAARAYLEDQARVAHGFGSPFVAALLLAGARHLKVAPYTATMMAERPGDRASAAVAIRFHSALHALARPGGIAPLAALFGGETVDVDHAARTPLTMGDLAIAERPKHPTQTYEVARSAAFAAVLPHLGQIFEMPVDLLEIGASAGLNLNLGRYRHNLGGTIAGDPCFELTIAPIWCAPPRRRPCWMSESRAASIWRRSGSRMPPPASACSTICSSIRSNRWID
jgi:hypothetical protein